jgi:Zn-finger nucleic acid-binding protein
MRTVDRHGVHIDQCEGCRGIFLDRGELEQISGAEQRHYAAAPPPYMGDSPAPYRGGGGHDPRYAGGYGDSPPPYGRGGHGDSPPPYGRGGHRDSPPPGYGHGGYGHKRKRRGFLEELFD